MTLPVLLTAPTGSAARPAPRATGDSAADFAQAVLQASASSAADSASTDSALDLSVEQPLEDAYDQTPTGTPVNLPPGMLTAPPEADASDSHLEAEIGITAPASGDGSVPAAPDAGEPAPGEGAASARPAPTPSAGGASLSPDGATTPGGGLPQTPMQQSIASAGSMTQVASTQGDSRLWAAQPAAGGESDDLVSAPPAARAPNSAPGVTRSAVMPYPAESPRAGETLSTPVAAASSAHATAPLVDAAQAQGSTPVVAAGETGEAPSSASSVDAARGPLNAVASGRPAPSPEPTPVSVVAQPVTIQAVAAASPPASSSSGAAAPALLPQLSAPVVSLARLPQGQHSITLTVSPETLGPVTVRAHIIGSSIQVELHSASDAGREALRMILAELRRDLAVAAPGASVDVAARDSSTAGSESQPRPDAQTRGGQQGPSSSSGGSVPPRTTAPTRGSDAYVAAPLSPDTTISSQPSGIDVYA